MRQSRQRVKEQRSLRSNRQSSGRARVHQEQGQGHPITGASRAISQSKTRSSMSHWIGTLFFVQGWKVWLTRVQTKGSSELPDHAPIHRRPAPELSCPTLS